MLHIVSWHQTLHCLLASWLFNVLQQSESALFCFSEDQNVKCLAVCERHIFPKLVRQMFSQVVIFFFFCSSVGDVVISDPIHMDGREYCSQCLWQIACIPIKMRIKNKNSRSSYQIVNQEKWQRAANWWQIWAFCEGEGWQQTWRICHASACPQCKVM